ncbi:winged helix-turn-helix domain-containing protein [Pseudomonas synxantha]|uniref:Cholera toxin transcriptional activator n=1 Tax=Pseudomonas synxantha TaxID=47883 RepID=A0ACC6JTD6_9PSED|nr:winged helix-turn-helix domain-containing protein [Pseudomonas synxantha]MDR6609802.1 cholera toxin transcriptional activator [Pseudomonas synxantha]
MSYTFKLKNGAVTVFDPDSAMLSITTPHGDVQKSTLGRAESRLLDLLLKEPGVTKSRDEIIDYTWNDRVVASGSLNQTVFSLRNILNDSRDHEILMTVPRRGYCFNRHCVVDETTDVSEPSEETAQPAASSDGQLPPTGGDDLVAPSGKTKKTFSLTKAQLIAYIVTLAVGAFTIFQIDFDTPKIEVSSVDKNGLIIHAVGNDLAEAQALMDLSVKQTEQLPPGLKGQVWINLYKANYSVSCIRPDLSTANLQLNSSERDLALMIRQCLEVTL